MLFIERVLYFHISHSNEHRLHILLTAVGKKIKNRTPKPTEYSAQCYDYDIVYYVLYLVYNKCNSETKLMGLEKATFLFIHYMLNRLAFKLYNIV